MIISYQWLLNYLPEPIPVADVSRILTSIGLEVEAVEPSEAIKGSLEGLVIGEVMSCEKHPNADKLSVTTVNIGGPEVLNIVCGAPNVAAGQRVVVAPVGAMVHPTDGEPFLIKKAKIRGADSEGMICAEDEIGLGSSHAGIMILPADAPLGTAARDYFKIPEADMAIHIGLTPNRSDAMSHIGVARDICAYLTHHNGKNYEEKMPVVSLPSKDGELDIKVKIDAPEACLRYTGIGIAGVKVGTSPDWLQARLKTIGVRSINNIVDITNFVLHEFGQPLHAFDADKIGGGQINVRFLPEGTKFISLDEKERTLKGTDLMICDENNGLCIAGVFGGMQSGVSDATTNIFLESAYFHPSFVRRTSLHHGLRTDAATHFEKGVDMAMVLPALERAAAMIVEIAGGKIASDITDVYPRPMEAVSIKISYDFINRLCGKVYTQEAVQAILKALHFEIEQADDKELIVKVPSNKTDVLQPADIVEEILRIDGLDNVVIPDRLNISLVKPMKNDRAEREQMSETLCGLGFQEIVTNSIVNSKFYPERTDLVKMLNSLSSELDVLRPSMLESGLDVIQYNVNRKSADLLLFEFGKTYTQKNSAANADQGNKPGSSVATQPDQGATPPLREAKEGVLYIEEPTLALWTTGNSNTGGWNQKATKADLFFVKGIVQNLLKISGITNTAISFDEANTTTVLWKWKNQSLCTVTEVDDKKLQSFDIKQGVYFAAINWELWLKAMAANKIEYSEVAKFPAVQRDLAIVLDKKVSYQDVMKTTEQLKLSAMRSFDLFDIFESEKLGADKKSYALSYTFQLQDRTLTDQEIDQQMQQLIQAYKTKLEAQVRE